MQTAIIDADCTIVRGALRGAGTVLWVDSYYLFWTLLKYEPPSIGRVEKPSLSCLPSFKISRGVQGLLIFKRWRQTPTPTSTTPRTIGIYT